MSGVDLADVDPARRAAVAQDAIHASHQQWRREHRKPKALTAREALAALQFEALIVWTAAGNVINGVELTGEDFDRLTTSVRWIEIIAKEAA